jgi:hypothetical protein
MLLVLWKIIKFGFFLSGIIICSNLPVCAQMSAMDDSSLERVCAGTGLSFSVRELTLSLTIDSQVIIDTESNTQLEFKNISLHGGDAGDVFFDSGDNEMITADIFTIDDPFSAINGQSMLAVIFPEWKQNLHISVENVVFAGTDIGSLDIGNIDTPHTEFYFSGHEGSQGLDWEMDIRQNIQEARYTYNSNGDFLSVSDITLARSATGAPETPADWSFEGSFATGDINNNNPATLDIITLESNNATSLLFNLPMQGTIRAQNIHVGGQDFGPIAIDGIHVHHMQVILDAGNF